MIIFKDVNIKNIYQKLASISYLGGIGFKYKYIK